MPEAVVSLVNSLVFSLDTSPIEMPTWPRTIQGCQWLASALSSKRLCTLSDNGPSTNCTCNLEFIKEDIKQTHKVCLQISRMPS